MMENKIERKENNFLFIVFGILRRKRKYLVRQLSFYLFIILLKFKNEDSMVILY